MQQFLEDQQVVPRVRKPVGNPVAFERFNLSIVERSIARLEDDLRHCLGLRSELTQKIASLEAEKESI